MIKSSAYIGTTYHTHLDIVDLATGNLGFTEEMERRILGMTFTISRRHVFRPVGRPAMFIPHNSYGP